MNLFFHLTRFQLRWNAYRIFSVNSKSFTSKSTRSSITIILPRSPHLNDPFKTSMPTSMTTTTPPPNLSLFNSRTPPTHTTTKSQPKSSTKFFGILSTRAIRKATGTIYTTIRAQSYYFHPIIIIKSRRNIFKICKLLNRL